jgi:hypothetical protein
MTEEQLLQKIAEDVGFMKQRIILIEKEVREISEDLLEVRPEYTKKLEEIDEGKFLTREEFKKELENA